MKQMEREGKLPRGGGSGGSLIGPQNAPIQKMWILQEPTSDLSNTTQ